MQATANGLACQVAHAVTHKPTQAHQAIMAWPRGPVIRLTRPSGKRTDSHSHNHARHTTSRSRNVTDPPYLPVFKQPLSPRRGPRIPWQCVKDTVHNADTQVKGKFRLLASA
jgi:hypothetical protein